MKNGKLKRNRWLNPASVSGLRSALQGELNRCDNGSNCTVDTSTIRSMIEVCITLAELLKARPDFPLAEPELKSELQITLPEPPASVKDWVVIHTARKITKPPRDGSMIWVSLYLKSGKHCIRWDQESKRFRRIGDNQRVNVNDITAWRR